MGLRDLHSACGDFWPILQYNHRPLPLLVCKIGQKSPQAKCKSGKAFFSKVFCYLGVDLKKKTSLITSCLSKMTAKLKLRGGPHLGTKRPLRRRACLTCIWLSWNIYFQTHILKHYILGVTRSHECL